MLNNTFQHIPGIGPIKEHILWKRGIYSWDDFERSNPYNQLNFFSEHTNNPTLTAIEESRRELLKGNSDYFALKLPAYEQYRIAFTFPKQVLFLDIETTGLSKYYDQITLIGWVFDGKYGVYIDGDQEKEVEFLDVITKAKCIVTFNGKIFDIPFIIKKWTNLIITKAHFDLRFAVKHISLSGGQKILERELGIIRPDGLQEISGAMAPILWAEYCRGSIDSLKQLIAYNHADLVGIQKIFNHTVNSILIKEKVPETLYKNGFNSIPQDTNWREATSFTQFVNQRKKHFTKYSSISINNLLSLRQQSNLRIVGIDITGSEDKASGWCLLDGKKVITKRILSNEELINETMRTNPILVSIDSPLSLPVGRTMVEDSDPYRKQYGITRYCERELKHRGVNVYPCLIRSMQKLTTRGILLAKTFRSLGIPVIESFPGAAQDIMRIPRKRSSIPMLKKGLIEFGLNGEFENIEISHDELDAITSAIVGVFFWSGEFEALGNLDEEYLIIPRQSGSIKKNDFKVIGFSGPIASGKTTAGEILKNKGFFYTRFSIVLADILKERGIEPNRSTLQELGEEVFLAGQRWLCWQLYKRLPANGDIVIDGLRHPEDFSFLVEQFGPSFHHVFLETDIDTRQNRYIDTGGTIEEFSKVINHPVENQVESLKKLAHIVVYNDGSKEKLYNSINNFLDIIRSEEECR